MERVTITAAGPLGGLTVGSARATGQGEGLRPREAAGGGGCLSVGISALGMPPTSAESIKHSFTNLKSFIYNHDSF